jgi:indolepyruvate ferredoxin oxidoreductase, alpha subunit
VAVAGDSTFYHACIPALINARANKADALFVVLDNSVTAMTGFQLNPASSGVAASDLINPIPAEELTRGLGIKTVVLDPVEDIVQAKETVYNFLQENGVKVIVFRRVCATFENKKIKDEQRPKARVDHEKCLGEQCGCDRFCIRILNCPAIQYDSMKAKAYIEEDICNGCSLCCQVCPEKAIMLVDTATGELVR